ncbi:terminase gpP N-terminus-related DNA-binding protein [Bacteroides pyogenes]|uniref:terminase gpP N-terminus-related DNA-binding protein n=1 Tax=Bacteroides pyogenes TaxID=310300 RepID=UPI001BACBF42|nr:terminase [Bacteroides pyogenes]MCE9106572.1 DUF1804 family protein [Bacteroides pyogenes]MCI7071288.1 DUF1804 family protein [Bacteroides pyogenes]
MKKKKEADNKKELARILYMNGENQQEIADKVSVSRVTVNRWVNENGWKELRAAKAVTRPELINKLLLSIDRILEKANEDADPEALAGLGDKLSKVASAIEKLDKKANVVDTIEVCISFGKWVERRIGIDKEVTHDTAKQLNRLQDIFINEQFNISGS